MSGPRIVDARRCDGAVIAEAVACLRRGGLVALPTETVYGLAARALDPVALARIFSAKGRPSSHPLIAHVLDLDGARAVASEIEIARTLADAFWPGPLTMVLPRADAAPAALSGGLPTIAVRAPAHPVARAVIELLGEPIAAPSANRYQEVSPTTAQHVARSLGTAVDLILDGGATERGIESTVIDLVGIPTLLRPGPIDAAQLRRWLPNLRVPRHLVLDETSPRSAPGLDARHYAPRASARTFASGEELVIGTEDGVVLRGPTHAARVRGAHVIVLPTDSVGFAREFYAALHTLDDAGVARIWIEAPPSGTDEDGWAAVRDRIGRATAQTVGGAQKS